MKSNNTINPYLKSELIENIIQKLTSTSKTQLRIKGLIGSAKSFVSGSIFEKTKSTMVYIAPDKESAAYILNDFEAIFKQEGLAFEKKKILFFPSSYKRPYQTEEIDNSNVLSRAEVLNKICNFSDNYLIVTYPEALSEKVISKKTLKKNTLTISASEEIEYENFIDSIYQQGFTLSDFVIEPGQFSIRGGIIDLFSFSNEYPYRIEFISDKIESIRRFDPSTQLSIEKLKKVSIIPNIQNIEKQEIRNQFFDFLKSDTIIIAENLPYCTDKIEQEFKQAQEAFEKLSDTIKHLKPEELYIQAEEFKQKILDKNLLELANSESASINTNFETIVFNTEHQPVFHKNFDLLFENIKMCIQDNINVNIACSNDKQMSRLTSIFEDLNKNKNENQLITINITPHIFILPLFEGFIDKDIKEAVYTDHQIFERFHRFKVRDNLQAKETLTLKELYGLQPGDYITHIDHGIGKFDGLETISNNGKLQESIRIIYKNGDLLYVNIHSLHRIAKYVGKEGTPPEVNKLGSPTWQNTKNRTKQHVKDIAKDLIKLYAKRKTSIGFGFTSDSYLQQELEASFIYEDTPDQIKSMTDIKNDMESSSPMDRLICGDVGFGKTELAIRAAFKAALDGKQIAVLVPTTILALQHYKTFTDRLKDFPVRIEYLNRFVTTTKKKNIYSDLKSGKIDILIGTQSIICKELEYHDLGLLIIDEEHKFGVAVKEKLRQLKENVDTLTLTATPIPRTLQFSLLGARDLSTLNTPPANRRPVQTELQVFNETIVRDAIHYEMARGGQIYFVHNRIDNIKDVAGMIQKFVPDAKIAIAHGRLEGNKLEQIMLDFIEGEYDVLLSTTIVESGLDIPNANTIIINEAQNFGLSDLHQLRGRVGRSNKKAFCYLLTPPLSILSEDAKKRLKAIEEFSNLGSGFNIAMRDLDIRGAGNLLGAEQSGFISDIGYEMYQKILNEAITELKNGEFSELYQDPKEKTEKNYVSDVQFDSDLEILFPTSYIHVASERLLLYKELDNIDNEETLRTFLENLIDRFGPLPDPAQELINVVRLRFISKKLGFEKIILKNNTMTCGFVTNKDSAYFNSIIFTSILNYVSFNPKICRMHEVKDKLTLTITNVNTVRKALEIITKIKDTQTIT